MNLRACFVLISLLLVTSHAFARDPNPAVESAILRLESRGAIVKPFRVAELGIDGNVVRLGDENDGRLLTAAGKIEPAVIDDLKVIPKLLLEIRGPSFADEGLADLPPLSNLLGLDLAGTKITGKGLALIGKLRSLRLLDLSFNAIDGKSLAELAPLANLERLSLIDTPLDDAAVEPLGRLRSLRELQMQGTNLSPLAQSSVSQRLNRCKISWPRIDQ